jgi:PAS domain S-box-containing protein
VANSPKTEVGAEVSQLRDEVARLRERLALLSDLSREIGVSLDQPTVLQAVVDSACRLTSARYGALAVFDETGSVLQFVTHGVTPEEREGMGSPPVGRGLLGWLQHSQEPLRLSDLGSHPQSSGFPPGHPPMKSFLGVPIRDGDEALGNIYLTEKSGQPEFSQDDEDLLIHFADQAAIAIRNARRFRREQDARLEAEATRNRLETLVNTSPVGVLVADADSGDVALVNREAERLLGVSGGTDDARSTLDSAAVFRQPDGQDLEPEEQPLQRALHRGENSRAMEMRLDLPDGRSIPTLVNASPIYDADNQITGAIAVIQDLTPIAEIERLRGEFLGMVSHEFRTPLTAIKGSAATVLGSRTPFDAHEIREFFLIIDEQADRLRDLVNNLLDITRIEAGVLTVSPERTDLVPLLEEARGIFVQAGGVQVVEIDVVEDLPRVSADASRIAQVLGNMLTNAGKFSPETAPISISVEADADAVTVQVRDRGRGIRPERLPHLFKKFSQVHDDGRRRLSGSGLGLAICKGIVEAHGGRLWAESDGEGTGTTFAFTLPVASESEETSSETSRRAEHLGRVRRAGERSRILAVDSEPQILRHLQNSLTKAGYQTIVTSDPSDVISLIEMEEPDLVLLDLMLSGTSGFDLLKQIREVSGVPVIMLSARERVEDTVRALRMGADDYIGKPFSPSELLARIEAALRRRVRPDQIEVLQPYRMDGLMIDFTRRRVIVDEEEVRLTATEYKLLYELATNAGRVLTHDQILQRVWGPEYSGETQLVRAFIRNLRRKLKDDANAPTYIFTEPQVGYRMAKI